MKQSMICNGPLAHLISFLVRLAPISDSKWGSPYVFISYIRFSALATPLDVMSKPGDQPNPWSPTQDIMTLLVSIIRINSTGQLLDDAVCPEYYRGIRLVNKTTG